MPRINSAFQHPVRLIVLAPVVFVLAAILHNLIAGLTGIEEPVFFLTAVIGAPLLFVWGLVRLAWVNVRPRQTSHEPK